MAGLGDVFGKGSTAEQFLLWGVGQQVAQAGLTPFLQSLTNKIWALDPSLPVSPDVLALLVARGLMPEAQAEPLAKESGVGESAFAWMVKSATHGPDLSIILEGLRRGIISDGSGAAGGPGYLAALQDLGIDLKYEPLITALKTQIPTVAEVMNAWLEGQITEGEAHTRYLAAGGDPTWFQTSYNANGSAPSPNEAATMANRGIIPWGGSGPSATSFEQAFLEGPWRNKWEPAWRKLAEYLPPPRTVTALQREGVITKAQALELYQKTGLSLELATAYVASASITKTQAAHDLTRSDVVTLYKDRLIAPAEAKSMLEALRYDAVDAEYLLAMADFQRDAKLLTANVSKLHTQYVGRKITKTAAQKVLTDLAVPADQIADIFKHWDIDKSINVKQLTESQIVMAWYRNIIDFDEASAELQSIGYSAYDAWVLISEKNDGPLPNKPAKTPLPGGVLA